MTEKNQSTPESKKFQIPMIITDEAVKDLGINPKDVVWRRIEDISFPTVLIDATEAEYRAYIDPIWTEIKRMEREERCMVPGKSGRLIKCPESKKCNECDRYSETCKEKNRPASLQFLVESGKDLASDDSFEETIIYEVILEDLIKMLDDISPVYSSIFRLLYEGTTQQEIADTLGLKARTVSDYVQRIRKIVQPLVKDIFDR